MSEVTTDQGRTQTRCVCEVVAAYVSNNRVSRSELPALIEAVAQAVATLGAPRASEPIMRPSEAEIRRSIQRDSLISFIDGKPYKALRRHLMFKGHSPESYRIRYGLPVDYPMVAPSYSERRSEISRQIGLKQRPFAERKMLQ